MIGDCTLSASQYHKNTAHSYETVVGDDYAYPFAKTLDYFKDDDFTFANLESPLTDAKTPDRSKAFYFRADPAYVNVLTEGSVEFVTIGNNHALDYGEEGYEDTKAVLAEAASAARGGTNGLYTTDSGLTIGVYALSFGTTEQIKAASGPCGRRGRNSSSPRSIGAPRGFTMLNATSGHRGTRRGRGRRHRLREPSPHAAARGGIQRTVHILLRRKLDIRRKHRPER
jgi:hypothetical protein